MALNLRDTLAGLLKENTGKYFTARELANLIYETKREDCLAKLDKSSYMNNEEELITQICAEIGASKNSIMKKDQNIRTTEERPRKYYYSDNDEEVDSYEGEVQTQQEADLYPIVIKYLRQELEIRGKHIDEKKSSKKRGKDGNGWLYPDIVGIENLSENWEEEVIYCVKECSCNRTKLYSYELKLELRRSLAVKLQSPFPP